MFEGFKVVRHSFRRWGFNRREPGYVDPRWVEVQAFYRDTYLFWGWLRVHRKRLFAEEIPVWAWVSQATMGFTEWRSACPPDIWLACTGKPKG